MQPLILNKSLISNENYLKICDNIANNKLQKIIKNVYINEKNTAKN